MTLLEVIQTFCLRTGIPSPAFVVAATDAQTKQVLSLLNEVCEDICERWTWTDLTEEATFTTVAAEDQGALIDLAPNGYCRILDETIFNRSLGSRIYGPLTASKWQAMKAHGVTGPMPRYRIRAGHLYFTATPTAGQTCAFEYASNHIAVSADGLTTREYPTADDDTFVIDHKLILAGLRWKWKCEKGLPYAEEFTRYEMMGNTASGRDGTKPVLNMGDDCSSAMPGIFISPGFTVPS